MIVRFAILFIFVVAEILPTSANAVEYFVSPTGSDSNAGTETAPFKTLKKGVSKLRAGDILTMRGGLYAGPQTVAMTVSGTADSPITVRSYSGEVPVIRCTTSNPAILTGASYLVFRDLVFDGNKQGLEGIVASQLNGRRSDHIRITRCAFKNHRGSGLRLVPADYAVVENCILSFNGLDGFDHGVYAETGDGMLIRKCIAEGNAGWGIHVYCDRSTEPRSLSGLLGGKRIRVAGNRCLNNGSGGIVVGGEYQDTIVENNLSYGNATEGIVVGYSDIRPLRTIIRNNTCFGNGKIDEAAQILVELATGTIVSNNIFHPGTTIGALAEITDDAQQTTFDRNLYPFDKKRFRFHGDDVNLQTWKSRSGETNAFISAPGFVNPNLGNFRLTPKSRAIDQGSAIPQHFSPTDFAGKKRPQGAGPDIGAYEFVP